jgi:hypothetical protein
MEVPCPALVAMDLHVVMICAHCTVPRASCWAELCTGFNLRAARRAAL